MRGRHNLSRQVYRGFSSRSSKKELQPETVQRSELQTGAGLSPTRVKPYNSCIATVLCGACRTRHDPERRLNPTPIEL